MEDHHTNRQENEQPQTCTETAQTTQFTFKIEIHIFSIFGVIATTLIAFFRLPIEFCIIVSLPH